MKIPTLKKGLFGLWAALLVIFSGWVAHSGQGGIVQTIKNANAPFDDKKIADVVLPVPENTVLVKKKYQGGLFWTETRKEKVERYRCSQCHNNRPVKVVRAAEVAHGDVALDHGGLERPLSCFTCHKKDERDFLVTEKGEKLDMDHSYRMCGQCHFRQEKDWVGGAHGKRVATWAGKRVVKNCTSCHDPHSPLFKKRWPRTYSPPFK